MICFWKIIARMKTGAITISPIAASLPHATVWYCGFTAACVMPSVSAAEALDRLKIKGKKNSCQLVTRLIKNSVARAALKELDVAHINLLFIENIGNLVCPSEWDLGEDLRAVVVSTTEGDDKPAKYPQMFAVSQVMIVNKLDLLPYVDYDVEKVKRQALAINPQLRIFEVSCRTGEGLDAWCEWLVTFANGKS